MCRMARPRKPLLSRDRIVEAASALVDAEGLDAVSTQPARRRAGGERALALQPLPEQGRDPRRGRRRRLRSGRPVDVRGVRPARLGRRPARLGRLLPGGARRAPAHRPGARAGTRPPSSRPQGRRRGVRGDGPGRLAARPGDVHRRADAVLHHRFRARLVRPRLRGRRDGVRPRRLPPPGPGAPAGRPPPAGRRGRLRDRAARAAGRSGAPVRADDRRTGRFGPRRTAPDASWTHGPYDTARSGRTAARRAGGPARRRDPRLLLSGPARRPGLDGGRAGPGRGGGPLDRQRASGQAGGRMGC